MYGIAIAFTCLASVVFGIVWSARDAGADIRIRRSVVMAALAACGALFISGCDPSPATPPPALRASTSAAPALTTVFDAPTTSTVPLAITTTDRPAATFIPAAPPQADIPTQAPVPAAPAPVVPAPAPGCGGASYINVDGACVHDPVQAPSAPPGATARCGDGTYSFSRHHRGTCSHHGGVSAWL